MRDTMDSATRPANRLQKTQRMSSLEAAHYEGVERHERPSQAGQLWTFLDAKALLSRSGMPSGTRHGKRLHRRPGPPPGDL